MQSSSSIILIGLFLTVLTSCTVLAPESPDAVSVGLSSSSSSLTEAVSSVASRGMGMRREAPAAKEVPENAESFTPPTGEYIGMSAWPPEIKREPFDGVLDCEAFRIEARRTSPFPAASEITLLGNPACKLHGDEGVAGSRNITDRYILVQNGEKITVDLVVRQEACAAPDYDAMMVCAQEQGAFWEIYNPEALVTGVLAGRE